jgi:hypothetical protein
VLQLSHPAAILALAVAAACVLFSVSTRLYDMDTWQHLAYGRALWTLGRVPTTQMWTWSTYGQPEINASWGFRALLWPFWSGLGIPGLFVLRGLVALGTFGVVWATCRRLGGRGFAPLVVITVAALLYRYRAQVRPEMLAGLLLATEIWLLESRRQLGRNLSLPGLRLPAEISLPRSRRGRLSDHSLWLIPVLWAWVNVHLSFVVGFAVLGLYWLEAEWRSRRVDTDPPTRLRIALVATAALSWVNPFGVRALEWPFRFLFEWKGERMESDITELGPLVWSEVWRSGAPLLLIGWPLLALFPARPRRRDGVELVMCLVFTLLTLRANRFLGTYAIVAAPFVARGLAGWLEHGPRPARLAPAWNRAAVTAAACVVACVPEWRNPDFVSSLSFDMRLVPVHACDFLERQGIGGHGMNHFVQGGYMAWRSWPSRDRLPFATIHTEYGTPEQRRLYYRAFFRREDWLAFDHRYAIDYCLLRYRSIGQDRLLDILDADSSWALVFVDDAAAVYVRRHGRFAAVAREFGYHALGAGNDAFERLNSAGAADSDYRSRMRAELERQAASSPANAIAHTFLGFMAMSEGRPLEARRHFELALKAEPEKRGVRMGIAMMALDGGRAREALGWLAAERRLGVASPGLAFQTARAEQAVGNLDQARRWLRAELERFPDNAEARDSLAALEARQR